MFFKSAFVLEKAWESSTEFSPHAHAEVTAPVFPFPPRAPSSPSTPDAFQGYVLDGARFIDCRKTVCKRAKQTNDWRTTIITALLPVRVRGCHPVYVGKMSMQQYCLRWNNHQPNFISVFSSLLNSESLVDVTLSAEGRHLQAHKLVLSACSSYFQVSLNNWNDNW